MIRSSQTFSGAILDPTDFVLGHRDAAAEVFEATADKIRPQALGELGEIPGPVKRPIEWALSPLPAGRRPNMPGGLYSLQKAAFFATDGFGKGIPFVRPNAPGNISGEWKMPVDTKSDDFKVQLRNDNPAAKYLFGSLSKTNPGRFQQRFHINTGWLNGYRVTTFWLSSFGVLYRQDLRKKFSEMMQDFKSKRRAYTAPRRA